MLHLTGIYRKMDHAICSLFKRNIPRLCYLFTLSCLLNSVISSTTQEFDQLLFNLIDWWALSVKCSRILGYWLIWVNKYLHIFHLLFVIFNMSLVTYYLLINWYLLLVKLCNYPNKCIKNMFHYVYFLIIKLICWVVDIQNF